MTRDDIRKLIGAYATGTLTEAEQKLLFDAALDDQELFDELTREHALKEILDEPGARDRLIAALEQPEAKRFVWWPWAAAATAAAAVVVGILLMRPAAKQEIAMVTPPPAPAAREEAARQPPSSPPASPPAAPAAAPARQKVATPEEREANQPAADAVAPALEQAQTQAAPAAPGARALSVGGAVRAAAPAAKSPGFSFNYAIDPGGILRITPAADGYLRAIAMNGDAAGPTLAIEGAGPDGRVQAGSQVSVNVSGREAVEILFSASPNFAAAQTPSRREEASGTVADVSGSPSPSLAVVISVK